MCNEQGYESRVYDLKNGKEERYREEVMSGCHVEWDGKRRADDMW